MNIKIGGVTLIYADNAATTRISDVAFEKMLPFLQEQYGNASSQYSLGTKAKRAVEHAREQIAMAIGAESSEITFTSGGSETNSWLLRSIADNYRGESTHIITSTIEHHSVLNACHELEVLGVEVTYLPVDRHGRILIEDVKSAVKPNTKLVSIMFANNEIGSIQPIAEVGVFLRERGILFHTDAVQAVGHIPVDVGDLNVDFLTASAHKFNGAKGTGVLYKRSGLEILPLIFGGKQERGLRAGTENVAGIIAAGYAIEESIAEMRETASRLKTMVDTTVNSIQTRIPTVCVNGNSENRLPGTVNLSFDGVSGESLMNLLDLKGICVSTSSACTSGSDEPSHVLIALGLSEQQTKSAIRISYGRYNNLNEVETIVEAIYNAYNMIKSIRS
ncbi:MAG: cysteine desulfurase [Bacteroidia bacterium]|nr:cysteine desulfurase [Bacteroidia bacterium]